MFWLALGSLLLVVGGIATRRRRLGAVTIAALVLLAALSFGSTAVYSRSAAAAALIGGAVAGVGLLFLFRRWATRQWVRGVCLFAATAAGLFALFGPAGGLF